MLMAQVGTDSVTGAPLSECIEKYLATREQELDARTLNQHRLALEKLQRFLEAQKVLDIREMTVDHLETFKTAGLPKTMRMTTKATTFAKIRCFSAQPFSAGDQRDGGDRVTTVKAVYEQKEPYTDAEVVTILDHASRLDGGTHGYAKQPEAFRLLIEPMLATGLRVGDAVAFDPRALAKETACGCTYISHKSRSAPKNGSFSKLTSRMR
jgi:site-specific recombinase XerD